MTIHPARPVPQGADPQLAGMLGPLLDHLTEPEAEPDWRLDTLPDAQQQQDELSHIAVLMSKAGHHGPLRDTIPALIAQADEADLLRERLGDEKRTNTMLTQQLAQARRDLDVAASTLRRRQDDADEYQRRASWVLSEALSYCVTEIRSGCDD